MAEIIYQYPNMSVKSSADINANIRWLTEEDIFAMQKMIKKLGFVQRIE